jgi:hypothetical protein
MDSFHPITYTKPYYLRKYWDLLFNRIQVNLFNPNYALEAKRANALVGFNLAKKNKKLRTE